MKSRNISFILGQHHPELDLAVAHHSWRNGFAFEVTTMHKSIGQEVIALWFDTSPFLDVLSKSDAIDLRVCGGLAATGAGPVCFLLWWLPPVNAKGAPFSLQEQILNPMHKGTRDTLRRLASQKYIHVVLVGPRAQILGLHEFKNEYPFSHVYAHAQAASEQVWPGYDFDGAYAAYRNSFEMMDLLHGKYPDLTLLAGDIPQRA